MSLVVIHSLIVGHRGGTPFCFSYLYCLLLRLKEHKKHFPLGSLSLLHISLLASLSWACLRTVGFDPIQHTQFILIIIIIIVPTRPCTAPVPSRQLPDKYFQIIFIQNSANYNKTQTNKISKTMNEQNERFNKETRAIKNKQKS